MTYRFKTGDLVSFMSPAKFTPYDYIDDEVYVLKHNRVGIILKKVDKVVDRFCEWDEAYVIYYDNEKIKYFVHDLRWMKLIASA